MRARHRRHFRFLEKPVGRCFGRSRMAPANDPAAEADAAPMLD